MQKHKHTSSIRMVFRLGLLIMWGSLLGLSASAKDALPVPENQTDTSRKLEDRALDPDQLGPQLEDKLIKTQINDQSQTLAGRSKHRGRHGRSSRNIRHYPSRYYHRSYYGSYYSPYYGYYPRHYGYYPYGGGYPYRTPTSGALDLNVKPKKTQVYLNGHLVGKTGKYDGLPNYLWLEEGRYELIFYLEGHETVRKEYSVSPNIVIRERFVMRAGETASPESLTKAPARKSAEGSGRERIRNRGERRYREHGRNPRRFSRQDRRESQTQGNERVQAREQTRDYVRQDDVDLRREPGQLRLAIDPLDASVYLDGEFIGTGKNLARRRGNLILDPGEHQIQVIRPGFPIKELKFEVEAGKETALEIRLQN